MRSLSIIIIFMMLVVIPVSVQSGWMKNYGGPEDDSGWFVEALPEGGYFVVANTYTGENQGEVWLLKLDDSGDTVWTKTYGGLGYEWASSARLTPDGGLVVTGYTEPFGQDNYDAWLLKTNSSGDSLWAYTYGDQGHEAANSVDQAEDGGYVVTGFRNGIYNPEYDYVRAGDIMLFKTSADGEILWDKTYGTTEEEGEQGFSVRQTADGGYIVACNGLYDEVDFTRVKLIKTDADGDSVWTYRTSANRWYYSIEQISDGSYVVGGNFSIKAGIAKINNAGSLQWENFWGTEYNNWAECVKSTPDGGYILTGLYDAMFFSGGGSMNGDLWLIKTDELGDTMWTRLFGKNPQFDYGTCVGVCSDGGYIVTGYTKSYTNGGFDLWVIRTDELGRISVDEQPTAAGLSDWQLLNTVGHQIVLRYEDKPGGFHALVFDASGRKVDEVRCSAAQGSITWGHGFSPGVYFIRESSDYLSVQKVILID